VFNDRPARFTWIKSCFMCSVLDVTGDIKPLNEASCMEMGFCEESMVIISPKHNYILDKILIESVERTTE
jgi:hypothetical protein